MLDALTEPIAASSLASGCRARSAKSAAGYLPSLTSGASSERQRCNSCCSMSARVAASLTCAKRLSALVRQALRRMAPDLDASQANEKPDSEGREDHGVFALLHGVARGTRARRLCRRPHSSRARFCKSSNMRLAAANSAESASPTKGISRARRSSSSSNRRQKPHKKAYLRRPCRRLP